ncbi:hypothetical protein A9Q84_17925 [Halobacteriovorax marinus]|uniref:Uncharacterized protein n=1 Tax=Halobacteriovorax marinus TaxID=97084 RepID=A0A1Y5F3B6_9BACT|nr:hypothetical protein A9Q84_17925 [Halobacteriovorax marinus]
MKNFLLILLFIFPLISRADVSVDDLEIRFKINSLMIQAQEQILQTFRKKDLTEIETPIFKKKWEKQLKVITEGLITDQLRLANASPSHISRTKKMLSALKWKKISSFMIKQVKNLRVLTRVNGLGLVMFGVFTNVAQFIVPAILTNAGFPVLAVISVVATGNVPTVMYIKGITYFSKLKKSYKNFKSARNFKRYNNVLKEVRKSLSGASLNDLILPLKNFSDGAGAIIKKEGILRSSLLKLGFYKDSINTRSLQEFLEKEKIVDPILSAISMNESLEADTKIALSLNYMDANLDGETLLKYKVKFQKSFASVHSKGHEQMALDWVKVVLKSKSVSDFDQAFKRVPSSMHPTEVFLLWEQVILPHYSKKSSIIKYGQFRKLIQSSDALKADIFLNERSAMNAGNRNLFFNYFRQAMRTKTSSCFKSHDQILQTLLH